MGANRLLVEGKDDTYTIPQLMGHHTEWPSKPPPVTLVDCNGSELYARGRISAELKSHRGPLGVVADADNEFVSRWNRIRAEAEPFFPNIPVNLPAAGLILDNEDDQRFGVWVMPDNRQDGMLESFLHNLVPSETDALWMHACGSTDAAKARGATYTPAHLDKARIHCYLSWVDPPGETLGHALKRKTLDPHCAYAKPFVVWFLAMFGLVGLPA